MENQQSVHIITVPFKSFNRDLPEKKESQSAFTLYRIFASQNSGSNETKPRWWGPRWDTSPAGMFFCSILVTIGCKFQRGNGGNHLLFNYPSWITLYFNHHWYCNWDRSTSCHEGAEQSNHCRIWQRVVSHVRSLGMECELDWIISWFGWNWTHLRLLL